MPDPSAQARTREEIYARGYRTSAELARTYDALAREIDPDRAGAKAIFAALAERQAAQLPHLAGRCGGALSTSGGPGPLRLIEDAEFADLAHSALVTPYRALSAAVVHCERAFVAWAYVAADLDDPSVRAAAEDLAGSALECAGALRRERRRAWRAEGDGAVKRDRIVNRPAARASEKEKLLFAELRGLVEGWTGPRRDALLALLPPGVATAAPAPDASIQRAGRFAEELAEAYIDAMGKVENAAGAARARRRAELSIVRLGRLRALLAALKSSRQKS